MKRVSNSCKKSKYQTYAGRNGQAEATVHNDQRPASSRRCARRERDRVGERDRLVAETGGDAERSGGTALSEGRGNDIWLGGKEARLVALNERGELLLLASEISCRLHRRAIVENEWVGEFSIVKP